MLVVLEHSSPKYAPRTYANAKAADLTAAFAVDFQTAGERLTHKAAAESYVAIGLEEPPLPAARQLYRALRQHQAHSLNIAGNGIYTLSQHGWNQQDINAWLYAVLAKVHEHWPITHVRSGGQTGVDMAGVTAAYALGIPATALLPKGYLQRNVDKVDRRLTADTIREAIVLEAEALLSLAQKITA